MSASINSTDPDPLFIIRSGHESVSTLKFCFINNEEVLISGTQHGLVQVWDLTSKRIKFKFQVNGGVLYVDVIHLDHDDYIISHDRNGKVNFWEMTAGTQVLLRRSMDVYNIGFCPLHIHAQDGIYWMAYPSASNSQFSVTKANLEYEDTSTYTLTPKEKMGMVMQLKLFSKDNCLYAVAGYEDGSVYIWNVSKSTFNGKRIHTDPVMCLDVDSHGEKIISGSADNKLVVLKISEGMIIEEHTSQETKTSGYSSCTVRKDGRIVACGGWDGKIRVYGWKKLKRLAILKYHNDAINCLDYGCNQILAAGSKDGKVTLWDVYKAAT